MASNLRAELPGRPADWEHADVACFAILAVVVLTHEERQRVADAVPPLHDDPARRARFYASPLYVYLTARGLAVELPDAARLATLVASDAIQTAARPATDLPALVLQLATVFELSPVKAVDDDLLRSVHARIITSVGEPDGAIAIRWLLERYGERWPAGADAAALRKAAERYAGSFDPTALTPEAMRPEVAVMRLETAVGRDPGYRLVRSADVDHEVASRLTRRHRIAAGAYALCLAVLCGGPAWALVAKAGAAPGLAYGVALMTWAPSALWAAILEYGRLRRDWTLTGTIALCLFYYGYFAYVVLTRGTLDISGKEAVEVIVPVVIGTMFGVGPSLRSDPSAPASGQW